MATTTQDNLFTTNRDGIRFSWNVWPPSRYEATELSVPLGCLFTPLKEQSAGKEYPNYEPLYCDEYTCRAILNPFCQVDYSINLWICNFCSYENNFPPQHANMIASQHMPLELNPEYSTIDYILPGARCIPPIFLFVLDVCIEEDELNALKESVNKTLDLMPPNTLVGLMTFGRTVTLYELVSNRIFNFEGTKDITTDELQETLRIGRGGPHCVPTYRPPPGESRIPYSSFFQPVPNCGSARHSFLERIQMDVESLVRDKRPLRSTGAAASIAVRLLESTYRNTGARIMLFVGGVCTQGPGMVVEDSLRCNIRTHHNIAAGDCRYMKKAMEHYKDLAYMAANNGHAFDIYSCARDQTGLLEMKCLPTFTGGHLVMSEMFGSLQFKQTFNLVFAKDLQNQFKMAFGATVEVKSSKELEVKGCIGSCASYDVKGKTVAEAGPGIVAKHRRKMWRMCSLYPNTTYAFFFDVASKDNKAVPREQKSYIQFVTRYQHSNGQRRIRITTITRSWADLTNVQSLASGFDQEAAAVLMAKLAVFQAEENESTTLSWLGRNLSKLHNRLTGGGSTILNWLDRSLIELCSRFGDYTKDRPDTFNLPGHFYLYSQVMFHFRRSNFLKVFNSSPDETTYNRHMLMVEDVSQSLIMIQPNLYSYSLRDGTEPVPLDETSLAPNKIFILDTFFHVLIYYGKTIVQWKQEGRHHYPENSQLRLLLEMSEKDAMNILEKRFPRPQYIFANAGEPQARLLLKNVNPSNTHNNVQSNEQYGSNMVLPNDVSLQAFMVQLTKQAVSRSKAH